MLEDKLLIWKLNRGSKEALCRIYEKYRDNLVRIAAGLVNDVSAAEDVVQEVFLALVHSAGKHEIRKNLKGYLTSCVVNKIRNLSREKIMLDSVSIDEVEPAASNLKTPDEFLAGDEISQKLYKALYQLPYEQKEAVILHIQGKLKFREIAEMQGISVKTVLSRYNYGLNKLRALLNSEVEK
ncbi:MAG: sigma-70 family RNA polymerase sigma factor [Sedimentisphaerales bacterium]|nr:sigma-70 family RNA polymerase sigma factor [Sedimentisphaerales bacterium]